jgi:hypothetical protein
MNGTKHPGSFPAAALGAAILLLLSAGPALRAAPPASPIDGKERAAVVTRVGEMLEEEYIFSEKAAAMKKELLRLLGEGYYDKFEDGRELARAITRDMQSISHDRHLHVDFDPEGVRRRRALDSRSDEERREEEEARLARERRRNFGFRKLEFLEGNVGYLAFDYFSGRAEAGATAAAVMGFFANADALIFDLRKNGGGNPAMVQFLCSYLLEDYTHLNSFEKRKEKELKQFWTLPFVPGKRLDGIPVFVLTSRRTFSGAEEFAYNLKHLERATLVGETTGGGAHPGDTKVVNDNFTIFISDGRAVNPITKTNWEGKGVAPHVSVPSGRALDTAHRLALEEILEEADNDGVKQGLEWALDGLRARTEPADLGEDLMKRYVGKYTRGEVVLEGGQLYIAGDEKYRLLPVSDSYFVVDGDDRMRIRFELDPGTGKYDILAIGSDGFSMKVKRVD